MKSTILCIATLLCHVAYTQSIQLLSQDGFTIYAHTEKVDSSKRNHSWNITVTLTTPASDSYFIAKKTFNPLTDSYLNRYARIWVANHKGILSTGDQYLKAKPANLITKDNIIFEVKSGSYSESFTATIPSGAKPDLRASLVITFKALSDIPVIKASDAELFAGTSPHARRFLVYDRPDTLLPPTRNHALQLLNEKRQRVTITYSYDHFHLMENSHQRDSLATSFAYLDWNDRPMGSRIAGNHFETSTRSDFENATVTTELHIKNHDGYNRLVQLEKITGYILVLGNKYPTTYQCISSNGKYRLHVRQDGYLALMDLTDTHTVWVNNMPGKVMFSTILVNDNFTVDIAGLSANAGLGVERPAYLCVTNEGTVVMYRRDGFAMWQSAAFGQ